MEAANVEESIPDLYTRGVRYFTAFQHLSDVSEAAQAADYAALHFHRAKEIADSSKVEYQCNNSFEKVHYWAKALRARPKSIPEDYDPTYAFNRDVYHHARVRAREAEIAPLSQLTD